MWSTCMFSIQKELIWEKRKTFVYYNYSSIKRYGVVKILIIIKLYFKMYNYYAKIEIKCLKYTYNSVANDSFEDRKMVVRSLKISKIYLQIEHLQQ